MIGALSEYYRAPAGLLGDISVAEPSGDEGFFRLGPGTICYGHCISGISAKFEKAPLCDALTTPGVGEARMKLPHDPARVIENLRHERYEKNLVRRRNKIVSQQWPFNAYYFIRNGLPTSIRRCMQRAYFSNWKLDPFRYRPWISPWTRSTKSF